MYVSVLICTRNRAASLRETLNSVFSSPNLAFPDWETVVVDNDSEDTTASVCRDFQARFPSHFRWFIERKRGKSNALNSAVASAQGEILAFTDDDVRCAPDYLEAIRSVFSRGDIDGVQGRILLDCEAGHPDWLDAYLGLTVGWRDCGPEISDLEGTLCGTNMMVRAEAIRKVEGFLPDLGPGAIGLGEETELTLRMRKAGCRLIYAPQILVWHRLSRKRLTKEFIRRRFFQQGRAEAYYARLPVTLPRFSLYVLKDSFVAETMAIWHLFRGRPALALRQQCEARAHAGFFWQHWLFSRGLDRRPASSAVGPESHHSAMSRADDQG